MKMTIFCLPTEWKNYVYKPISIDRARGFMHGQTVVDSCNTEHGIAIRIKFFPHGRIVEDKEFPTREKIIMIETNGEKLTAQIADLEKDRLPGYPLETVETGE